MSPGAPSEPAPRRVVIVGGGASGTLCAIHLLRLGGQGLALTVVEPREALGLGVAFGTPDPWHRLNVPAMVMSGLPEDPADFVRWAGVPPDAFPSRLTFGRYLQALLADAVAASPARLDHVRTRATGLEPAGGEMAVDLANGEALIADDVVIATGNELPRVPSFVGPSVAAHPRFVRDPWAIGALDAVRDGDTIAIIGTGHTALDLAASLIGERSRVRVVALSRHGELPRSHEVPIRPRPPVPAFSVDAFRAFADPLVEARERIRAYEGGWRQGLDSLRPIAPALWQALDDDTRRRFVGEWRREWEVHRSRISAGVAGDVEAWRADGVLEIRPARIGQVVADGTRLRIDADEGAIHADHVLLATGPDEAPGASPFAASLVAAGLVRPGPVGLGIDADPQTLRVVDAAGSSALRVYAVGPILRGVLFETIAIPEIRAQAAGIAARIVDDRA